MLIAVRQIILILLNIINTGVESVEQRPDLPARAVDLHVGRSGRRHRPDDVSRQWSSRQSAVQSVGLICLMFLNVFKLT